MEVSGQLHVPAALPPAKEPSVLIRQEAEWAPEPVWTLRRRKKILSTLTPFIQSVASHYTDWATHALYGLYWTDMNQN
jgi:hypothetical protein